MPQPAMALSPPEDAPSVPAVDEPSASRPGRGVVAPSYHRDDPPRLPTILESKIQAPPLRPSTLTRHRLLERLPFKGAPRVTLVVADAGFGKTTLLTEFSSRFQGRCLWYRLDDTDRDWVTIVNYLVAAVRETGLEFGSTTEKMLNPITGAPPSKDAVVACLMHELQQLADQPAALVLDDLHSVDGNADACELITRLIRDAPASMSFVLASRRRPQLHLARWSAMGEVAEMTTDELRFSTAETERLFAEGYSQPLEPEALRELDRRTKGWAATLQLFHSLIRGRSAHAVRSVVRSLSGATGPIYEYLAEEVLGNMPVRLHGFVVRAAALESVLPEYVVALDCGAADLAQARALIDEAEDGGILTRASQASADRRFHPLLREFLVRKLGELLSPLEISALHGQVARAAEAIDVLTACHHHLEAGDQTAAVRCLGSSVIHTLGSGRSGAASQLIDRLTGAPSDPAIMVIQARRLMEDGDIQGATTLLADIDVTDLPPTVRAVIRHTRLSLGWRRGDSASMFDTLREISKDTETPPTLREIAQIFVDASPMSTAPVTFSVLAQRLRRMAKTQTAEGHHFYAAISLHNAGVAELTAGRPAEAVNVALEALEAFDRMGVSVSEPYSTHALLAVCYLELGREGDAEQHVALAIGSGMETADVHAECAYSMATVGHPQRATSMLTAADALARVGKSDLPATMLASFARALLAVASKPQLVKVALSKLPGSQPLDLGYSLERRLLISLAHLLAGDLDAAESVAASALIDAEQRNAGRCQARLNLMLALARQDSANLTLAIADTRQVGEMALLQLADALGQNLHLVPSPFEVLGPSLRRWPRRWLPVLRRQLESGSTANGVVAALLLDEIGTFEDIGRLRAYAKTYRKRGVSPDLGRALARRVSPLLTVGDLGRVRLAVGDRQVLLTTGRRKPAALLMYLVTRPAFTATREQVLEELWPESDPDSASNNLNQTLYFLRRAIDPWYETGVSAEYVAFESEILWLDPDLVRVSSAAFVAKARQLTQGTLEASEALKLIDEYTGPFSPEFEYEEWASTWRVRVHSAFLEFSHSAVTRCAATGDLRGARDLARAALAKEAEADELERQLIALDWALGARTAAQAQYLHYAASERRNGLEPQPFDDVLASAKVI